MRDTSDGHDGSQCQCSCLPFHIDKKTVKEGYRRLYCGKPGGFPPPNFMGFEFFLKYILRWSTMKYARKLFDIRQKADFSEERISCPLYEAVHRWNSRNFSGYAS